MSQKKARNNPVRSSLLSIAAAFSLMAANTPLSMADDNQRAQQSPSTSIRFMATECVGGEPIAVIQNFRALRASVHVIDRQTPIDPDLAATENANAPEGESETAASRPSTAARSTPVEVNLQTLRLSLVQLEQLVETSGDYASAPAYHDALNDARAQREKCQLAPH